MEKKSNIVRYVLCAALCGIFFVHQSPASATDTQQTAKRVIEQFTPDAVLKQIAYGIAINFFVVIAHELGHAVAAKVLYDQPINMHIGSNSVNCPSEPFFSLFDAIHVDDWLPFGGHSRFSMPNIKALMYKRELLFKAYCRNQGHDHDTCFDQVRRRLEVEFTQLPFIIPLDTQIRDARFKNSMVMAAGALNAIGAYYLLRAGASIAHDGYKNWSYPEEYHDIAYGKALANAPVFDGVVMTQLINLLLPLRQYGYDTDGMQLWRAACDMPDSVGDKMSQIFPYFKIGLCIAYAHYDKQGDPDASWSAKIAIGVLNSLLGGWYTLHT